jgi:hypothetical protein
MKNFLLITFLLIGFNSFSQDTTDFSIKPNWVNPETEIVKKDSVLVNEKVLESKSIIGDIIEKITPSWVAPEKMFEPKEELTEQDVKSLAEQQKGEAESMEKIARNQLDELKKMNGTLGRFITATRYGIASAASEELGYRKTGEVFEKKVKGVLPEFAGETRNWQVGTMEKIKVFSDYLGAIDLSPLTEFTDWVKNITSGTISMFGMGGRDTRGPNETLIQSLNNPNLNIPSESMTITTDNKFSVDFKVSTDEKISAQAEQDINKAVSDYFNGPDSRKNMENLLMRIDQIRTSSGQKPIFKK